MKPRKEFTVLFEDLVISVAYENLYVKPVDRIAHHDPAWGIAHSHREYEVHLLMNGTGWIRSEFGDLVLHDSEICIIAPNVIHSTMQMQDDTAVWSSFRFRLKENGKTDQTASMSDSIYGELYSINMARILTVKSTEAAALIEKVHEAFHLEPPFSEYKGKAWFTLLFMSLFEDLNRLPTNGVSEANKKNDRVQYENRGRMIEKYINENYNNPITVSMLAQELYLGVKQTARLEQYVGLNGIYSVYIYNAFQDQVYSGTGSHYPYSRADFKDQTALTCVENGFTKGGSSFAFFYRPYLVGEAKNNAVIEQNIFTLVFYPYQTQEIAIVVNSYPEYMLELLRNNEMAEKGVFLMSNQEGEVLFTTNLAKQSVDTERLEAYLTGNRAADMPESLSADGESYSVIYSFSKNLNYHFAWLIPKSEYSDLYFFNDTVFLFVITVVVSLLGLLVVFFGTWRLSVSLSKLLNGSHHTESDLHLAKAGVLKKVVSTMLTPKEMEAIKVFSPIFSAEHLFLVLCKS